MKHLKSKLLALSLICFTALAVSWSVLNSTINLRSKTFAATTTIGNVTAANAGKDTLVGAGATHPDTGVVYVWTPNNATGETFDLYVAQLTGSITACSITLQGSNDTTVATWSALTDWHNITPVNTYCADCSAAANITTVPGASKHYFWFVPPNTENWKYKRIWASFTGTFTATYKGQLTNGN